ncbi:serine/threonine-protein kinase [Ramlibacter pallidus]|uniref:Serine/threonine protein kinase n=1 Tax=Ramlibacter pallidus TaxID=2780087 RepID=A0ABR9S6R4_9BURK|nr:serine/threonine protein kinase [Ramlibacter pallidus]
MTLKKLGRYEVLRVLGKGAMGVVYEGRDPNLDRRVAIKTVKVENLSEEAAAEYEHRFRTEARSAARLQHPNIVSVYDSDRDADVAFLVMEYIQGDDLKHHLDRGTRYSLEQSLKIIRDLLSALDYAHKQGIVHRDIKPANLLIEPGGRVKLTDFGVARIQDSGEATRTQGSMVGTLKYMAPEQVQGQKIDSRADLFSVGVVLYQLLTDKRPFDGDNDFSIIHQIIGHHPPPPSSVNPRLPGALDAVVARALAKTREERFATARDFAVALQAAIRRAEDQTVVPPQNPNKKMEPAASRPLTAPGSVPGHATTPSTAGSVTQELELVYWKDVKDSDDVEDLHGFLEKFPAGIYADLARRRVRRLTGGEPTNIGAPTRGTSGTSGTSGNNPFAATQFPPSEQPDEEATRLRSDTSRPAAGGDPSNLRPSNWIDEEYTRTVVQAPPPASTHTGSTTPLTAPATVAAAAAVLATPAEAPAAQPAEAATPAPEAAPAPAVPRRRAVPKEEDTSVPLAPPPRKKVPVAVLAGIGALAVAGLVAALVIGRGGSTAETDTVAAVAPATHAAAAGAARALPAPPAPAAAPADAPVPAPTAVAAIPAPAPGPAAAAPTLAGGSPAIAPAPGAKALPPKKEPRPVRPATTPSGTQQPAPGAAVAAAPRIEPEPPPRAPAASTQTAGAGNYQAVEACRERVFLSREICLADACEKAGTRNHPLCVKRREDARLREESKQNGPAR